MKAESRLAPRNLDFGRLRDRLLVPAVRSVFDERDQAVPAEEAALDPRHQHLGAGREPDAVARLNV